MAVIQLKNVTKYYGQHAAVDNLSMNVEQGQIVGLLGPNGSGKTTTIRLINGVISPDAGSINVLGLDPATDGDRVRAKSGVLTESAGLYEGMTAKDNLKFFAALYGLKYVEERIEQLLEDFGLADAQDKLVGAYSTGMKKRLGIARALLHKPEILFLDEPTNGLDPEGSRSLLNYIRRLNEEQGVTILICTHLLKQVQDLCHSFAFIDQGRFLEQGTLIELEDKYLGAVKVEVETPLDVNEANFPDFPVIDQRPGYLVFQVQDKEQIPQLLAAVLAKAPVYSGNILGRDLEALYFKIRGEQDE